MSKKTILVTGGAGFIGSHLCERLIKNGHKVICLDNLFTGSKKNISHLIKNKNFNFVLADVEKPFNFKVDEIYHLACPASPIWIQKDPIKTIRTSILGSINALDLAKKTGARILFSSTSEVYGDPEVHPQKESYWGNVNPNGLRSCYDEGKRCAESLFFNYLRMHKIDIRVVRIFNTYGPRMSVNDGRVVANFIIQALKNKPLSLYGEGSQTRSFCYIEDMINGLTKMMEKNNFNGPVNLGNPKEFTIMELAQKVKKITGSKSKIVKTKLPDDDPTRRRPDISLAKRKLNWQPKIQLETGLKLTLAYFKEIIK
jgi:UDP-glucuronate decarboxylase